MKIAYTTFYMRISKCYINKIECQTIFENVRQLFNFQTFQVLEPSSKTWHRSNFLDSFCWKLSLAESESTYQTAVLDTSKLKSDGWIQRNLDCSCVFTNSYRHKVIKSFPTAQTSIDVQPSFIKSVSADHFWIFIHLLFVQHLHSRGEPATMVAAGTACRDGFLLKYKNSN